MLPVNLFKGVDGTIKIPYFKTVQGFVIELFDRALDVNRLIIAARAQR